MTGDLLARLRVTFVQELDEHVRQLNTELLAFESDPHATEPLRAMFRSAHTVKGAARVAGVPLVEQACHSLESIFADARDEARVLDADTFSLMFAIVDALGDAGQRVRQGESLDASPLAALIPRLIELETGTDSPVPMPKRVESPRPQAVRVAPTVTDAHEHPHTRSTDSVEDLVRVRADRLDALLKAVGELTIATGRIVERSALHDPDARRLDRVTDDIFDVVRRLRLRPFADVCEGLPRAVRDIAASQEREIELELHGQDVEADRLIVDALRDPLLHLVRNAVDHGIEAPDERERKGKSRTGHVRVAAELARGRLVVTVSDDGAGLDERAIRDALRERGRAVPTTRAELGDALLAGNFSTRRSATAFSGRGVGVDVARTALERIGGTVDVEWSPSGTTFTLECPPTPATLRALLVNIGAHVFAIPTAHVERLRRISATDLHTADGRTVISTEAGPIHVHSLANVLGSAEGNSVETTAFLVIVAAGSRRAGFVVDRVIDEDEIVVRPLDVDAEAVPYAAGAFIMTSGRVALVLNAGAILAGATRHGMGIARSFAGEQKPRRRVLVADDSITTRTMEQSVLEAAGFDVVTAVNGEDAWGKLQDQDFDAVVADVEMPRMDGIAFCQRVRASSRFAKLPFVLVTGLESDSDRARGMEAGADAYIVKSGFDQATLLSMLDQFLGDA